MILFVPSLTFYGRKFCVLSYNDCHRRDDEIRRIQIVAIDGQENNLCIIVK